MLLPPGATAELEYSKGQLVKSVRIRNFAVQAALVPSWLIVVFAYVGSTLWTISISFTSSGVFPRYDWVGWKQYDRLFNTPRWIGSLENLAILGTIMIVGCLVLGYLLAVFIDQKIRGEGILRTIFLYPYAMSLIVTGLVWQWILNPTLGIQKTFQLWGFADFTFDWLARGDRAIYLVAFAGMWQMSGLVMAIFLAGLRGIDADLWKASKIDGIPAWRMHLSVIIPMLSGTSVTAIVLLGIAVVKAYD